MQQKWNQNFDGEPMTDIPQKFLNAGCDVYMVMQLRHDEKILDERFASMRELHRRGKTPDPEHYEVTYYADLPAMWQDVPDNEVLEELFQMFNLSRPQDFEGHSLSVSDVIAPQTQWRDICALCGQHRLQGTAGVSGQAAGTPFGADESKGKVRCPGVQSHGMPESEG